MKTCYYELLGVESNATDTEIKKAYRRQAIIHHPDKNPNTIDESTENFNLIRSAYEVLSDPQERAWYDSHKNQILQDDSGNGYNGYDDDGYAPINVGTSVQDLLKFFDPSLYSIYDSSPAGYYGIINKIFDQLMKEEIEAGKQEGLKGFDFYETSKEYIHDCDFYLYKFGNENSEWNEVVRKFYSTWGDFQSVKNFNWFDEYRYSEAPDRRVRRAMEKENKKLRDDARKEYNETVRSFVYFIKKRDPRVKANANHEKELRKKKLKEQKEMSKMQSAKDRMKHAEKVKKYELQDWQKIDDDDLEEFYNNNGVKLDSDDDDNNEKIDITQNISDDEEIIEQEIFECVICDKVFKSEKQLSAHEKSKKHLTQLNALKRQMKKEGIHLGLDEDLTYADEETFYDAEEEVDKTEETTIPDIKSNNIPQDHDEIDHSLNSDDFSLTETIDILVEDDYAPSSNKSKKKKKKKKQQQQKQFENIFNDDPLEDKPLDDLLASLDKKLKIQKDESITEEDNVEQSPEPTASTKKSKKKKNKESVNELKCSVCQEIFPSRNKLFQHVNSTGHAAPPPKSKKSKSKKK